MKLNKGSYLQRLLLLFGLFFVVFVGTNFTHILHGLAPDITGAGYRLFATSASTTPGTALAATNTSAQLSSASQSFRLRTGLTTRASAVDVTAIEAGYAVSCATVSGLAYCSGRNTNGELGNGDTTGTATNTFGAVQTSTGLAGKTVTDMAVSPLASAIVFVSVVADGQLYSWGNNNFGTLGNGTTAAVMPNSFSPVAAIMDGTMTGEQVKQVDSGDGHTCGVTVNGKGFCFGAGGNGRLGDGTTTSRTKPTEIYMAGVLAGRTIQKIVGMSGSSCALSNGAVYCWGNGNLGNGSGGTSVFPVAVDTSGVMAGKTIVDIFASAAVTCALDTAGKVYCWGSNTSGEIGNGSSTSSVFNSPVATDMVNVSGGGFKSISGKQDHFCGIGLGDNSLYCWGANGNFVSGIGTAAGSSLRPVLVTQLGGVSGKNITYIGSGRSTSCVVASGTGYCIGYNALGSLGVGTNNTNYSAYTPVLTTNFAPAQGVTIAANALSSRLEYAAKTAATCSVQTGFAAISTTTPIAWSTNASVASGSAITAGANDPFSGTTTTAESYVSATADFTNPAAIVPGNSGLWDFSLKDNSGLYNQSYCIRLAQSNGTAYTTYTSYPEVKTAPGVLSVGFYDATDIAIPSPTVSMPSTTVSTQCQAVTGTLSSSGRKLRVINDSGVASWGLSIAATGGNTSVWQHTTQASSYDYNDPSGSPAGCYAGNDGDIVAGQLTVNPSAAGAAITPKSGCTNTGVSLGSQASFNQTSIDNISIASGSSSAQTLCYWDLTDIGLSQQIPPSQTSGTYQIDLTLTVIAQ